MKDQDSTEKLDPETGEAHVIEHADQSSKGETQAQALQKCQATSGIQDIVSRYVSQLLYGCGDSTCQNSLCDTGRRHITTRPVRRYTPRSARAIAITLASGSKPKARLCRMQSFIPECGSEPASDGPRDPTAIMQILSDTTSARNICSSRDDALGDRRIDIPVALQPQGAHAASSYQYWNGILDSISATRPSTSSSIPTDSLAARNEVLERLHGCIQWLIGTLPRGEVSQWQHVNKIVSAGGVYQFENKDRPSDPSYNTWLAISDALQYEPAFHLFSRVLDVSAKYSERERASVDHTSVTTASDCSIEFDSDPCLIRDLATKHLLTNAPLELGSALIVWLKKAFLRYWDGNMIVKSGTIPYVALLLLSNIFGPSSPRTTARDSWKDLFHIPAVAGRVDATEMAQSWIDGHRKGHLLTFGFIFNINQQATYFRAMNYVKMRQAVTESRKTSEMYRTLRRSPELSSSQNKRVKYLAEHYLLLNVSRSNVIQDAFDQLWQRRRSELLRPLRVRLGEMDTFEVGHDLGGVQIEFFNLICRELFSEPAQMFTTDATTGYSYFRPGSLQPLYMFELCGLLFALALYNGISLPVNLPLAFYLILTRQQHSFPDVISDAWPVTRKSLKNIANEELPGMDWTFPLEANGLRLTIMDYTRPNLDSKSPNKISIVDATPIVHHSDEAKRNLATDRTQRESAAHQTSTIDIEGLSHAWPGWDLVAASEEPKEVTSEDVPDYTREYVHWLTYGSVRPQWTAFLRGIHHLFDDLSILSLDHLRTILEGSTHFDLHELRRVTEYEGYDPNSKYIQNFWRMVASWPVEKQKQLLKFVTACERIPPGGASSLTFKIKRGTPPNDGQLPTSSTCFGMLVLPKYDKVEILEKKLSLALKYGLEGFGSA